MFKIRLNGVESDSVIGVIEDRKLIVWKKIWDTPQYLVGVYIISPVAELGSIGVTMTLDYRKESRNCYITVISFGEGGTEELVENFERAIKEDIIKLAQSKDWSWKEFDVDYTIIQCPHCQFAHSPFTLRINKYEIIECSNCGLEFSLEDTPEIREDDYSRIECPFCNSVEDYKDYHVSWDRTVSCLNCGRTILLAETRRLPPPAKQYFDDW